MTVSTLKYDRATKSRLYALDGLLENWIVNGEQQTIEVLTEPQGERFTKTRTLGRRDTLSPLCLPAAKLDINWLFESSGY